ncbi:MAG: tetratricopeptide repeat protein [Planctomycetota bacterium]|nr:tetratricopeptide repeat protein [Planctomycetota bacterium]
MSNSFNNSSDIDTKDRKSARAKFNSMFAGGRSFSGRERNCCYLNTANRPAALGKFANISGISGFDFPDDGRALAIVDWDQDGDLDLWTSNRNAPRLRFMRNNATNRKEAISLRLVGDGNQTNRDAIGARVELVLKTKTTPSSSNEMSSDKRLIKTVRAGEGFLSQSSKWVHFGLPEGSKIESIQVDWPGGEEERFSNISTSGRYLLIQGSGSAKKLPQIERALTLKPTVQDPEIGSDGVFRMATYVELPPLAFETWQGKKQPFRATKGENLLILFWASSCPSCLQELKEIAEHEDEIRSAGLDVLALSVDGLQGDPLPLDRANRLLNSIGFYFRSGRADRKLIQKLESLNILKTESNELPLPFSVLLDYRSRLLAVYRGPVTVEPLLESIKPIKQDIITQFEAASALGGTALEDPIARNALRQAEADVRFKYAHKLQEAGALQMAARQHDKVLEILPNSEKAMTAAAGVFSELGDLVKAQSQLENLVKLHPLSTDARINLGGIYLRQNKLAQAVKQYDRAIELSPDDPSIFFNRAVVKTKQKKLAEALDDLNLAISLQSDFTKAKFQRGILLTKMGRTREALQDFDEVLIAKPEFGQGYKRRGIARLNSGMFGASLKDFSQAIKSLPQDAEIYNNRAMAFTALRNYAFAIADYKRALEVNQEEAPQIFNNLAWLLATCPEIKHRDGDLALEYAKQACELSQWSYYGALDTLAAAYAEVGRFEDAVRWQKKAIAYAPEEEKNELQQRLKIYEEGKPYRAISTKS